MENDIIKAEVYRKTNKSPVHWKLQIPKRFKSNAIDRDLYHSWRISLNFYHDINQIRSKYSSARHPMAFVNSVINDFESKKYELMILKYLFNDIEY